MQEYSISPIEMLARPWRHRDLLRTMTKREIQSRYRGSLFGLCWTVFNPLFMLAVYTFVFSVIFNARWGGGTGSKSEFALVLFAGLILFNLFAECFNASPNTIPANANYVKKVIFPLDLLLWVNMGAALFHALISLGVWLFAYCVLCGVPPVTILYLPLVLVPLGALIMGISWTMASLGVFLRDVAQVVGLMTTVLMFLSPIFYPVSALPEAYRSFLLLNPLMPAIEIGRNVMFFGKQPDWLLLGGYYVVTMIIAWLGFAWFQKTRKGFADVL
jgi:lipopolysaccharide transport system permease protein